MAFFSELNRRNVLRVAIGYLATSWLLIQVVETLFPLFGLSDALVRGFVILLAIGFPIALLVSWTYDLTPQGFELERDVDRSASTERNHDKQFDRAIIIVLTVSVAYFAIDKFVLDPARDASREASVAEQARSDALIQSFGDKSIAVLPFVNMSSDTEQDYFSDGISEELLNLLSKFPELRVISRTSAFAYRDSDLNLTVIADQLNVDHILEGSVRKAGDEVRITAQLIDARTDTHLWSQTYDRSLDDIFATQSEIATQVAEKLALTLLQSDVLKVREIDPRAYAIYLQAHHMRLQNTPEAYEKALQLYEKALSIDAEFPRALEGLAEMYVYHGLFGMWPVEKANEQARETIERALEIDPDFGVGVAGLGWIAVLYDRDLVAATEYFERALRLDPTNHDIVDGAAYLAEAIGRNDIAIEFKEYAVARDPMGPVGHISLALSYLQAGRAVDAEASARIGNDLRPGHIGAASIIAAALVGQGDLQSALETIQGETFEPYRLSGLSTINFRLDEKEASDGYLAELIDKYAAEWSYEIAAVFARRGDDERALEWLSRALEQKEPRIIKVASSSAFQNFRSDPDWQAVLAKIGVSDDQLAEIDFDVHVSQ